MSGGCPDVAACRFPRYAVHESAVVACRVFWPATADHKGLPGGIRKMNTNRLACAAAIVASALYGIAIAQERPITPPSTWVKEKADVRIGAHGRIVGLYRPSDRTVTRKADPQTGSKARRQLITPPNVTRRSPVLTRNTLATQSPTQVGALVIDSPPLDGFVPWVAVVATDQKLGSLELDAVPSTTIGGSIIIPQPLEADFAVGLLDTGASVTVMGNAAAVTLGLFGANKVTITDVIISGVTGSVTGKVSQPIGIYIDGLDAIDVATGLLDTTDMVGEYNVAIAVGQTPPPGQPDLPTAIGAPLAVYYAAVVDNTQRVSRTIGADNYESPLIRFHETYSPEIPEYPNLIPLELRPLGAQSVQYAPCLDIFGGCPGGFDAPTTPSFIIGIASQSLYFLGSVDLYNGGKAAIDKDRFMLDTGAQVTVVGSRVGARLGLNPNAPHFLVEIQGVDGQSIFAPGFTISAIQIPALGEWLSFNNVPVVLLDVNSPEGGTLDGIIGMNLLTACSFVLRGGGLMLQPDPSLEYEITVPLAVNCDFDNDADVDLDDFGLMQRCFTGPDVVQNEPACLVARMDADGDVDGDDLQVFMDCLSGPHIPAAPECIE